MRVLHFADLEAGLDSPERAGSLATVLSEAGGSEPIVTDGGDTLAPGVLVAVTFLAVSVGNLAKVLPLSPGGVGLYEGAFTLLVTALTPVGAVSALSVAVVDHAVKNVVTIAGGVVSMALLNVSLTTAVEESREVEASPQD